MMLAWLKQFGRSGSAVFLCLALAACATPQKIGNNNGSQVFERTGRFALNVTYHDNKQDAVQGGFAWQDDGRNLTLDLANPLGSTLARVDVVPGHAKLTRSNGATEQAPGPDALVELVLGSPIPVAGLRDWLRGRTGSSATVQLEKNEAGQITGFEQNGWRVVLSRYDAQGPRLLQMNRNEAGRRISVRLVVDGQ
ncbi:MAG TPA: lipoprotein insertase outer membrane protein LolB [Eoetvoesiella sp.]